MLVAVFILAALAGVNGHAGHLHDYPGTPEGRDYARFKAATCNKWVAVKPSASGQVQLRAASAAPTVNGNAVVWTYLYKNCSTALSSGIEVNITATSGGKPAGNYSVNGEGHIGTCNAPGAKYLLNATGNATDPGNRLWFHHAATNSSGRLWGNAANDGAVRVGPGYLQSFVLYDGDEVAFACCTLTPTSDASADNGAPLAGLGVECDDNYMPINATLASDSADTAATTPTPSPSPAASGAVASTAAPALTAALAAAAAAAALLLA